MPILILVVVVLVLGAAIAWGRTKSKGQGPLAVQEQDALQNAAESSPTHGLWCLVWGLIAVASVAMIGQATYGWVPGFDPPGWLRIVTFWLFPAGLIASATFGIRSLKQNSGRTWGITGLALALLSLGSFFAMLASVEY